MPFDKILTPVQNNSRSRPPDHEGQPSSRNSDLHRIVDLGVWWQKNRCLFRSAATPCAAVGPQSGASAKTFATASHYALEHPEEA